MFYPVFSCSNNLLWPSAFYLKAKLLVVLHCLLNTLWSPRSQCSFIKTSPTLCLHKVAELYLFNYWSSSYIVKTSHIVSHSPWFSSFHFYDIMIFYCFFFFFYGVMFAFTFFDPWNKSQVNLHNIWSLTLATVSTN